MAMACDDMSLEVPLEGGTVLAEGTLVRFFPSVRAQVAFQLGALGLVLALEPTPANRTHEHTHPLQEDTRLTPPQFSHLSFGCMVPFKHFPFCG